MSRTNVMQWPASIASSLSRSCLPPARRGGLRSSLTKSTGARRRTHQLVATKEYHHDPGMRWIQDALERATLNLTGRARSKIATKPSSSSLPASSPSVCLACAMSLPQPPLSASRTFSRPMMPGRSVHSVRNIATKSTATSRGKLRPSPNNSNGKSRARPLEPVTDLGSWGLTTKQSTSHNQTLPPLLSTSSTSTPPVGVTNLRYLIYSTAEPSLLNNSSFSPRVHPFPAWLRQQTHDFQRQLERRHHIPSAIVPPLSALQQLWRTVFAPRVEHEEESPLASTQTFSTPLPSSPSNLSQQALESLTKTDWGLWIMWLWHHGDYATLAEMHALVVEQRLPHEIAAKIPDEGLVLLAEARIRQFKAHQQQHPLESSTKASRSKGLARIKTTSPALSLSATETTGQIVAWIQETIACQNRRERRPLVELYELWIQEAYEAQDWQMAIEGHAAMEESERAALPSRQQQMTRRPKIQVQVQLALAHVNMGDVQGALVMVERALMDASQLSPSTMADRSHIDTKSSSSQPIRVAATQLSRLNDRWRSELGEIREQLQSIAGAQVEEYDVESVEPSVHRAAAMALYPLVFDALCSGEQEPRAAQLATDLFRDWLALFSPSSSSSSKSTALSPSSTSDMDPALFHKLVRFVGLSAGSAEAEALVSLLSVSLDAQSNSSRDGSKHHEGSDGVSSKIAVKKDKRHSNHQSSNTYHSSGNDTKVMTLRMFANIGCQEVLMQALREGEADRAKRMFQILGAPALQLPPSSLSSGLLSGGFNHRYHSNSGARSARDPKSNSVTANTSSVNTANSVESSALVLWLTPVQNGLYDLYLESLVTDQDFGMAMTVLQKMLVHDRVPRTESIQRLIGGMIKAEQLDEALGVYRELTEVFGVKPTPMLLQTMMGLAAKYGDLSLARKIRRMLVGMENSLSSQEMESSLTVQSSSAPLSFSSSSALQGSSGSFSHQHDGASTTTTLQQQQQQEAAIERVRSKIDRSRMYRDLITCYMNHMNIPGAFRIFESIGHAGVPYEIRHINALLAGTIAKGRIASPDTTIGILEVMTTLHLRPNVQTYSALLKAALLNGDRRLAERWFHELAVSMLSGKGSSSMKNARPGEANSNRWSTAAGAFDHWRAARHGETFELLMGEYVRMYGAEPATRLLEGVIEAEFCVPRLEVFRMLLAKSCDEGNGRVGHRVFQLMKQQQEVLDCKPSKKPTLPVAYLTSLPVDLALYHRLLVQLHDREQDVTRAQEIVTELIVSGVELNEALVEDAISVYAKKPETSRAALGIFTRMKRVYGVNPTPKMVAVVNQLSRHNAMASTSNPATLHQQHHPQQLQQQTLHETHHQLSSSASA